MTSPTIIRTDTGFSVLFNGKQFPIPIGFMRVSEVVKVEELLKQILEESKCLPTTESI